MSLFNFSLAAADAPGAVLDVGGAHITGARVELRGGLPVVAAHATEALPPGAVVPSLTASNIRQRGVAAAAVNRVLTQLGRPKRIGLVVPDPVAKVSLLKFDEVPARERDLEQLIQWQTKKSAPFPIEEGQLSYVRGTSAGTGAEFIVSLARRQAIEEYESLCAEAGAQAGVVDLSTFNVANAVLAGYPDAGTGDCLLLNIAPEWASVAILRDGHLILFRSRGGDSDGSLMDLVHQTAMYFEDRLQGAGFRTVLVNGASHAGAESAAAVPRSLEERLGVPVANVDPRRIVTFAERITAPPELAESLAPLVGLAIRDREVAA